MSGEDGIGAASVRRTVGPVGDPDTVGWWERLWAPFWTLPSAISALAVNTSA